MMEMSKLFLFLYVLQKCILQCVFNVLTIAQTLYEKKEIGLLYTESVSYWDQVVNTELLLEDADMDDDLIIWVFSLLYYFQNEKCKLCT